MLEIRRMTLAEYYLRIDAYKLQRVDREYDIHLQAWVNNQAKAEKKKGKNTVPYFKSFDKFYDYEKRIEEVTGKPKEVEIDVTAKRFSDAFKTKHS